MRLQSAATPMVPAPMKRTSPRKVVLTRWATSPVTPCAAVSIGTSPPQAMSMPNSMAAPTESPTRCPTPMSAIDRLVEAAVAPRPTRKATATSLATSRIAASSA